MTVPGSGIKQATGCPLDHLHAETDEAVLREILIDRQLGQGKWNEHALNRRHPKEGQRLTRAK